MWRAILGAIGSATVGIYLLWFIIPILQTAYNSVVQHVDTSDPNIQRTVDLGTILFMSLGGIVIFVTGYTVIAYATERLGRDI
jgi:hypothetical protein